MMVTIPRKYIWTARGDDVSPRTNLIIRVHGENELDAESKLCDLLAEMIGQPVEIEPCKQDL